MYPVEYQKLVDLVNTPEERKRSVVYLTECLRSFLRPQEKLLVCFPEGANDSVAELIIDAARNVGVIPVQWGPDLRWKELLRQSFQSRATAIVGPPLVILGLTKLAKATRTPLFFRNVITAGYPCLDWMIDGIQRGLDCTAWGCYGPGSGPLAGGFSCDKSRGVHLRDDCFTVQIEDDEGNLLPEGSIGSIVISPKSDPTVRYHTLERGRLESAPCACGLHSPRLMDLGPGPDVDKLLVELGAELMSWGSILDCRLKRGEQGLELELVTFQGERLPKLPSCARLVIRAWDPERDEPNWFQPDWRKYVQKS